MRPFDGKFAPHRRSLARIKGATWRRAAAHSGESLIGGGRPRWLSGWARCRVCSNRWPFVLPESAPLTRLECHRCGSRSGEVTAPDEGGPDDRPGSFVD